MKGYTWNKSMLEAANRELQYASPRTILEWGYEMYGDKIVMATGFGTSGIVMMHILSELQERAKVFYLDTDLLFPETYALKDQLKEELDIEFVRVHSGISVQEQGERFAEKLWERAPNTCCFLRKVVPLRNFLADKSAWVTGVRRDQAITRAGTQIVEWDSANQLLKLNPLAYWTSEDVWAYIRLNDLPYNVLHDKGYPSIGCQPCTRAVKPGDDERAGRWVGKSKVECGIHLPQISA